MVVIPPIFTSNGKTGCSHLYISLAKLATNSNLYIVVSLVVECEISLVFSVRCVFLIMKMAGSTMVVIPPVFTSNGKTKWFYLYISLSELAKTQTCSTLLPPWLSRRYSKYLATISCFVRTTITLEPPFSHCSSL